MSISDLVAKTSAELAEAEKKRADLDSQIERLTIRLEAFREAAKSNGIPKMAAAPEVVVRTRKYQRMSTSPAQMALVFLHGHPGATTTDIADRLESTVGPKGPKSARKVIADAVSDLLRREKIRRNDAGGFVVNQESKQ